ncbi:tetratricopeptide repeat protein [Methylotuvimicrobium buryatense]|uniref:Sel1 repeat family protein n=1 Tax=Methylotuvimicrobium buryatense TaxID=95641 RepID=A0A4P9UTV9_METBY|nr:tetratricopeptide repeat protein [Methylotuvimicrobium buryatense]QCW83831.1 sel1 repeat family protein [Methylotuvimicrobium buryatense]
MSEQNTISKLQTQSNKNDEKAQLRLALERYANPKADDDEGADEYHAMVLNWLQNAAEEDGLAEAQLTLGILSLIASRPEIQSEDSLSSILNDLVHRRVISELSIKKHDPLKVTEFTQSIAFWSIVRVRFGGDKFFLQKHLFPSPEQPFHWLTKAAEQECAEAQYWLGYLYFYGLGIQQNKTLAVDWFSNAAANHFAAAQYQLACCYYHGEGLEKNDQNAFFWANKAVEQTESFFDTDPEQKPDYSLGIIDAYLLLSKLYTLGNGVEQNSELAYQWFIKAAEHWQDKSPTNEFLESQFRSAQFLLSHKNYEEGMGYMLNCVKGGYVKAGDWLIKQYLSKVIPESLENQNSYVFIYRWCSEVSIGHSSALPNLILGLLRVSGKGVDQNDSLAFEYFNKAHDGFDSSDDHTYDFIQLFLMMCYALGKGVEKDLVKADRLSREFDPGEVGEFLMEKLSLNVDYGFTEHNRTLGLLRLNLLTQNDIVQAETFFDDFFSGNKETNIGLRNICLTSLQQAVELEEKNRELEAKNKKLEESEKELEDTMAMFAHKFRSPLDAIIYNTEHEHQEKLYKQAAQTMRGLLDIFSLIATDADKLQDRLQQDCLGNGNLITAFGKVLNMVLLHLLSPSAKGIIRQHYLRYAKAYGLCDVGVSSKQWYEDCRDMEQQLQQEWEQGYAQLLGQSATLEQRLTWLERRFFKLELLGFGRVDIQFDEYGITESLLTIVLNEFLVNTFKYYASVENMPVVLEWTSRDGHQVLTCRNPSTRHERTRIKGSGKGHIFLSALARKIGSEFIKPKPADDFVVEFSLGDELLISNLDDKK